MSHYQRRSRNRLKGINDNTWKDSVDDGQGQENREEEEIVELQDEQFIEEDQPSEAVDYKLTYFKAALFATVLEDTVTELRILGECNNELRIIKTLADIDKLRALKYQITQPEVHDELDGIDPHSLGDMRYKLDKMAADRKFMNDVLVDTYLNLTMLKSYDALIDHIGKVEGLEAYRTYLADDEAKNKITRREQIRQLRQQKNRCKTVNYDTDVIIEDLKSQVEDAALLAEAKGRYVVSWQRSRTEQNCAFINDEEAAPSNAIRDYRRRSEHEQRVHNETEMLMNIMINENLQEVDTWMVKYDKDMEAIDLKIQMQKIQYLDMLDKRIQYEHMYEKHGQLMKNWVDFKNERERARLRVEKMQKSAVTVQAWWRGLLVRLQLGPYNPRYLMQLAKAAAKKKKK